jgi:hypothetical protein
MIRPTTCLCMLMAAGSGLYLYQSKHQAQLLDREINRVMAAVDTTRARTGVLRADYALLNEPSRLSELAGHYLTTLATTQPSQFTNWAELDKRLPPIGAPAPAPSPLEPDAPDATMPVPVAQAPATQTPPAQISAAQAPTSALTTAASGAPVAPAPQPTAASPPRTGEPKPAALRNVVIAAERRPALTQPIMATQPLQASAARVAVQSAPLPPPRFAAAASARREPPRSTVIREQPATVAHTAPTATAPTATAPTALAPARPSMSASQGATNPGTPTQYQRVDHYTPLPGTTAAALARMPTGAPVDPSVPVVASALGMARSMMQAPYAISPANAAAYSPTSAR